MTQTQNPKTTKTTSTTKKRSRIQIGEHITLKQQEDSGIWYITHPTRDGINVTYSTGTKGTATDIKRWVKEAKIQDIIEVGMRAKLTAAIINQLTSGKRSWNELITEYNSWQERTGRSHTTIHLQTDHINRFLREMQIDNATPANSVTEGQSYDWVNNRLTCRVSTRKTMLSSLRSFWDWMQSMGYVERNVMDTTGIRMDNIPHRLKEKRPIKVFTEEEFTKYVSDLEAYLAEKEARFYGPNRKTGLGQNHQRGALISKISVKRFFLSAGCFAYALGLRLGDCKAMEWDSFSKEGWIIVHTDKTNARVAIPYSEKEVEYFLENYIDDESQAQSIRTGLIESARWIRKGLDTVNQNESDMNYLYPRWKNQRASSWFGYLTKELGLEEGKTFHSFRHSRIRRWRQLGISVENIGMFVGHSNTKTTEGYLGDDERTRKTRRLRVTSV